MDGGFEVGEAEAGTKAGLIDSVSGAGVGENMLRLIGGADRCLDLLWRPALTRLEAPYDIDSGGLSSRLCSSAAARAALLLAVFALPCSEAAIKRALPR